MTRWILGGIAAVLATWFGVTALAAGFVSPPPNVQELGQLGDSFGAVSALFAGLGSLGVVIVLAFDIRHRQEELRPFVAIQPKDSAQLTRAEWSGGHYSATLEIEVFVSSASASPALNLHLTASAEVGGHLTNADVVLADWPLGPDEKRLATVSLSLTADAAKALINSLTSNNGVRIHFSCRYGALNKTSWMSRASFTVSARAVDAEGLLKTLDPESGQRIQPSGTADFATGGSILRLAPVADSWSQERVTKKR